MPPKPSTRKRAAGAPKSNSAASPGKKKKGSTRGAKPKTSDQEPSTRQPTRSEATGVTGELDSNLIIHHEGTFAPGEMSNGTGSGTDGSQREDALPHISQPDNIRASPEHIANSLGEAFFSSSVAQLDAFTAPVDTHVHPNLKNKIWKSEFVEFCDLLPQNRAFVMAKEELKAKCCPGFHWENVAFNISSETMVHAGYGRSTRRKEILTIGEWTDAMLVYMQIYLEKHHNQCFNPIKYASIVRQAAARHWTKGALEYDREFRMKKALYPNKPFQLIDGELYYSVLIPAGLMQNTSGQKRYHNQSGNETSVANTGTPQPFCGGPQSTNRMPVGVCWAFNKGNCERVNCAHPHKCAICGRTNHGQYRCFYRDRSQPQQSNAGERQQSHQNRSAQ